ncbi:hypothetical protein ACLOJK_026925 [Asimina triloba]
MEWVIGGYNSRNRAAPLILYPLITTPSSQDAPANASFASPISDKPMAASGTHPAFRSRPIQKPQQRPRPTLITHQP